MAEVDQIAEQLYASPPDSFVAARDEAAAAAKAAGDPKTARAIAALKKPTVAAWAVNLLALRSPDLVEELTELAGELSRAQRQLRGEQLRELSARRRALVDTLVRQTRSLTTDAGLAAGKLPLAEIEATFNAAFADPAVAAQLRAGRLLKTTSYAGFGGLPDADEPAARALSIVRSPAPAADRRAGRAAAAKEPASADAASDKPIGTGRGRTGARGGAIQAGARPTSPARSAEAGAEPTSPKQAGARVLKLADRSTRDGGAAVRHTSDADRSRKEELANLRDAVDDAREQESQARAALDQVIAAERQAEQELAKLEKALLAARRERDDAKEELSSQRLARTAARRKLEVAVRKAEQAEAVLDARSQPG